MHSRLPLYFFFFITLIPLVALGSHNLAGQIYAQRVRSVDPTANSNLYEIVLTTYTDPAPRGVDRCQAIIEVWSLDGNGQLKKVADLGPINRENGQPRACDLDPGTAFIPNGVSVRGTIKRNIYRTRFLFPGPGRYVLRYYDVARNASIRNMDNSGATAFFVETMVLNSPITPNTSPELLNEPLDDACTRRLWTHNPAAYDADGDILRYSLIPNQQYDPTGGIIFPTVVQNYRFPNEFGGSFTIDPDLGLVSWNTPQQVGIYNIAIRIEEFRNGVLIGYVIRDMAIFVNPCNNNPPEIRALRDTCILPGVNLSFEIEARDPDGDIPTVQDYSRDSVYLYLNNGAQGNNGPFQLANGPATMSPPESSFPLRYPNPSGFFNTAPSDPPNRPGIDPATIPPDPVFNWTPLCEHIRSQPYRVDFYAHDNLGNDPTLAANHITTIKVVAPPPRNLVVTPGPRQLQLAWQPTSCTNATGYNIYRALDSNASYVDTVCCDDALTGYELIGTTNGWNQTSFVDNNNGAGLVFRSQYCYRVTARYPASIESCPSNIDCEKIQRNMPIMLIDSIDFTDANVGQVKVAWQSPDLRLIDPVFFPTPYTYTLEHSSSQNPGSFATVAQGLAFADTSYLDLPRNTLDQGHLYRVRMFDATGNEVEVSDQATSIFLQTVGQQDAIRLIWRENVPWTNFEYEIWRQDPGETTYNRIATVTEPATRVNGSINEHTYLDTDPKTLTDATIDNTYCYYILGRGSYFIPGVRDNLVNASQIRCDEPIDTIPPCLPPAEEISITGDCDDFSVEINWTQPEFACAPDLAFFRLYYAPKPGLPYVQIWQSADANARRYRATDPDQQGLGGCYALTAVDTRGNESDPSEPLCFENCPVVKLPNVFTPNGDGINDTFVPIEVRNVLRLRIRIFNRWGEMMHESRDIDKLWEGTAPNGQPANEGTYFYVLEGALNNFAETTFERSGSITLIR
ncbi:MAG: gliding motility-associated C-terminal domain-containing protein [Sphingobacteriia bacterium]|jgi:gliding motility-associated-like protein